MIHCTVWFVGITTGHPSRSPPTTKFFEEVGGVTIAPTAIKIASIK